MQLRLLFTGFLAFLAVAASAQDKKRKDYVTRIESCEAIIREFQANPKTAIPAQVLQQAKGLVIVNEFQAGIVLGGKGGNGIVVVRRPDGGWSVPAFLDAGEASLGLQLGAKTVYTVYVLVDDAGARLLSRPKFNFGVDAVAVAGPRTGELTDSTPLIRASVLVYRRNSGLYAGTKLKTGWLAADNTANQYFYNTERTMPEILFSNWIATPEEAKPLLGFLAEIAH